ncbi:MAG: cobalt-precorrin-5B (C(1))-methyltransferase [Methanotrichaceae archaeon]|nr:cobalt-precorrin-5B (C(1))-methyltransferase [Methanotrichaceae archaeon]
MRKADEDLIDPVNGYHIPPLWLERSNIPDIREKIESGMWVLLSDGQLLRRGYTTGTTAAAACKGAVMSLRSPVEEVEVPTPAGIRVKLAVHGRKGSCLAIKDGGDHEFDLTNGLEVLGVAMQSCETEIVAGEGIGRITRKGLWIPIGKPAISQSANRAIHDAIIEGLDETGLSGARVELSLPRGRKIAPLTHNPEVGVEGGLSILGSTGFVEPWNEHMGECTAEKIADLDKVVVTTGRIGLRYSRVLFPNHTAVLLGSRLDLLRLRPEQDSVVCGLPGLILRWALPDILQGSGYATVGEMAQTDPGDPAIDRALDRLRGRLPKTRIVLIDRIGRVIRDVIP